MSRYAYDPLRRDLVVSWPTGGGDRAAVVSTVPTGVADGRVFALAKRLTWLCEMLWLVYTQPATAADSLEPDSEGWRRQVNRAAFALVPEAMAAPNTPDESGYLFQAGSPIEEAAHRVGRALLAVGDPVFGKCVLDDVAAELDAIEGAERGDLSGRGAQAVSLTAGVPSPVQVAAADELLRDDPLGNGRLFTDVDPVAASIAAAHWLQAAADIAGPQADVDPVDVVREADDIEALPVTTPTLVLARLVGGETPHDVVVDLVTGAMRVANGEVPDLVALLSALDEVRQAPGFDPASTALSLTPLDPTRPALDRLEDLLSGIRACWLLAEEHGWDENDFVDEVRSEALAHHDRLI